MATDAITALENVIREELPRTINESLPQVAPIFSQIMTTSMDVTRATSDAGSNIGRGWKVIHLYSTGLAGLIQNANPAGPGFTRETTDPKQSNMLSLGSGASDVAIFPVAERAPHSATLKRTLTLHMITGNFNVPVTWLQADALDATQVKQVARDIKEVGNLHAMVEAASFFHAIANDGSYDYTVLGRVTSAAEHATFTDFVTITINPAYGRIHNFRNGMVIDIVATSTDTIQSGVATDGSDVINYTHTANKYIQLVVVLVDYLAGTITLRATDTSDGTMPDYAVSNTNWIALPAAGDWITLAHTTNNVVGRPMLSYGLEDWIKSSGYILGGTSGTEVLDLAYMPQFKSSVVDVSGPLTEDVMNRYIAGYLDAYPGQSLDTILTSNGVTLSYLNQPTLYNNRFNFDRTGKSLNFASGWSKLTYSFNGRELEWVTSPMSLTKRLYGLKLKDGNIKRYVPPTVGGADARISAQVEFLGPITGHTGIFMPVTDTSARPLNYVQAPFWRYMLTAPIDPRGCKLTGLSEATMV